MTALRGCVYCFFLCVWVQVIASCRIGLYVYISVFIGCIVGGMGGILTPGMGPGWWGC